jgi:hypothetical protein
MRALIFFVSIVLSIEQLHGQHIEGVELIEFTQSACDRESNPYRMKPRIISMSQSIDTLLLEIGLAATCCLDYLPNIKYLSDTLYLNFGIKDEGEACACSCCYSFNFKIKGVDISRLTVKFYNMIIELSTEKYWANHTPTFVIIEGDTLNRKDKFGFRQGIWTNPKAAFSKLEVPKRKVNKFGRPNRKWNIESTGAFSEGFQRYKDDKMESSGQLYKNLVVKEEYNLELESDVNSIITVQSRKNARKPIKARL